MRYIPKPHEARLRIVAPTWDKLVDAITVLQRGLGKRIYEIDIPANEARKGDWLSYAIVDIKNVESYRPHEQRVLVKVVDSTSGEVVREYYEDE